MESCSSGMDELKKVFFNEDEEMKDFTRDSPAQSIDDHFWSNLDETLLSLSKKSAKINDVEIMELSLQKKISAIQELKLKKFPSILSDVKPFPKPSDSWVMIIVLPFLSLK